MTQRLLGPRKAPAASARLRRVLLTILLSTLAALLLSACSGDGGASQEIIVSGSTTILPIAEVSGEMFAEENPGTKVLVSGLGSSAGIESVSAGTSDIGTASRDLKDEEEGLGLVDTPIALDAIAVIVSPTNPIEGLTSDQVRDVFAGKILNWKELGGEDRPIGIVNRDEASGTREAFFKILMEEEPFFRGAAVLPGTGQVRSVVSQAPGAIGYISLGFVTDEVKAIRIDGIEAASVNVANGTYPIQRTLHFFTRGEPEGVAAEYIGFVLSDSVQQGVVRDAGFLPVPDLPDDARAE